MHGHELGRALDFLRKQSPRRSLRTGSHCRTRARNYNFFIYSGVYRICIFTIYIFLLQKQVLLWGQSANKASNTGSGVMQVAARLPGHESTVVCLEFSPDNK